MAGLTKGKNTFVAHSDGVFVYLGPSIRGIISNGSIYHGTKTEVVSSLQSVIAKYPKVETLLIRDSDLIEARKKLSQDGNRLSIAYKTVTDI